MRNSTKCLHRVRCLLAMGAIVLSATRCAKDFEGEYEDPNKVEVISDKWNETDARKTAEAMIKGLMEKPWIKNWKAKNAGKKPIVVIDEVENRTDEHIDTKQLTEFIRNELINSDTTRFLNKEARERINKELGYQNNSGMVAKDKAMAMGRQLGAQFFLGGAMTSNVQTQEGLKTVTYQTNLMITDLTTAEIVGTEVYHIKKRFKRSGSSW